ncbi:MAG: bifunctional methylenetetrahydrofolate dehydrogenase/methenyltetrahydrofolate cyclohydrolase FolD [Desulfovibrio sp.]|nr:bifunctional methylenetetrahydrofolate dehydrogenase/methenyltetrahydrofolate cyclohydrolase FolD [Desulfovibrio sp.]
MLLLDGKATALKIRQELKDTITTLCHKGLRAPGLAVILAGNDPASEIYVRNKEKACEGAGIRTITSRLPATVSQAELLALIAKANQRNDIDGILVQLPLPAHLDTAECLLSILPDKDVDGFHPDNAGRLLLGLPGLRPCTPQGILELLARYGLACAGKRAVIVGRSNIVGKPLALMLAQPGPVGNATVTLCHSQSEDLADHCRNADFLFLAVGRPKMFGREMIKTGACVVDVGINRTPEGICGDADFEAIKNQTCAITPVPGGVGPMTIAMLIKNTVQAWQAHLGLC